MDRRISGSPRSTRRRRGPGRRSCRARRPSAPPNKSPCATMSRRGRAVPRAAFGRSATAGIARRKTCIPPGSRSYSTRRSTRRRRGLRCMKCLRDRSRNMLFDHLGLREDEMNMIIRPDCADLPYFLRAYFAFKMGLPFGYSKCSRGGGHPPKCVAWLSIQHSEAAAAPSNQMRRYHGRAASTSPERRAAEAARARAVVRPLFADPRRRRAFRIGANGARRQQYRLLSGAADAGDAAAGCGLCRSLRSRSDAGASACRRRQKPPAYSSPSMGSPTARLRASVFGAAISCSRRIPSSAARASSAFGRSWPQRAAACGA